jgi:hypothetical protein
MSLNLSLKIRAALKSRSPIAIASIIAALLALPLTAPVFAQSSLDSSAAPTTDYAVPPPDGSLVEPSMPGAAASDDSVTDDSTTDDKTAGDTSDADVAPGDVAPGDSASGDSSTSPDTSAGPPVVVKNGTPDTTPHRAWDRVGDVDTDSESEDPTDKVLEVPQVVQSQSPETSDDAGQTAGPDQTAGADQTAGPDQTADADQSAQGGDFPSPDDVGSVSDYQNDADDSAVMGVYIVPVPYGPVGISPYAVNTYRSISVPGYGYPRGFLPGFVPGAPFGTVNVRGFGSGMNSAIMRTSPMFPHTSMGYSGGMRFSSGMFGRMR